MIRKMRTINAIIKQIKEEDDKSNITRNFVQNLILSKKVFYIKSGNRYLVDYDDVIDALKIRKEAINDVNVKNI